MYVFKTWVTVLYVTKPGHLVRCEATLDEYSTKSLWLYVRLSQISLKVS